MLPFLFFSLTTTLTSSQCNYSPTEQSSTIICPNTCVTCTVTCSTSYQCKTMILYSGARDTIIECTDEGSCLESEINIGTTGTYPIDYSLTDFDNEYNSISILCTGKSSCLKSKININVDILLGSGILDVDSGGLDSFKTGLLTVNAPMFNLNCGDSEKNCDAVIYTCKGGDCLCNNVVMYNELGCKSINYIVSTSDPTIFGTKNPSLYPTGRPTENTFAPTSKPTTGSPSAQPTTGSPNIQPSVNPTLLTLTPTLFPTIKPTGPTIQPSHHPTPPTFSVSPTAKPTTETKEPTKKPTTGNPTLRPTTISPIASPSYEPTISPIGKTLTPTITSLKPTEWPTITPTSKPTNIPTSKPTINPTIKPICDKLIEPINNDIIVCDKNCNKCEILCSVSYQCKSVQIYSSAKNTSIICSGSNSCNDIQIYIGDNNIYPIGYDKMLFNRDIYDIFTIDCIGKTSCLKLNTFVNGKFILGGEIDADSGGQDSLKDGMINVNFLEEGVFNLNCGESVKNCYASNMVNCYNQAKCYCNDLMNGNLGGCALIADNVITHTGSPTIMTIEPSITPTLSTPNPTSLTPTIITITPTSKTPSITPTKQTKIPTNIPTFKPTNIITSKPTILTPKPTNITPKPTNNIPLTTKQMNTNNPTVAVTNKPTSITITTTAKTTTMIPGIIPTNNPVNKPTNNPIKNPTNQPSYITNYPTLLTMNPTINPSINPTKKPSNNPSVNPTNNPSVVPTKNTNTPSMIPTSLTESPVIKGNGQSRSLKSSFKVTIIIFTIISALLLLAIASYYLYTNYQNKLASEDDLTGLDGNIAMHIPSYKKPTTHQTNSTIGDGVPTKITNNTLKNTRKESFNDFRTSYIEDDDIQIVTDDKTTSPGLYDDDML